MLRALPPLARGLPFARGLALLTLGAGLAEAGPLEDTLAHVYLTSPRLEAGRAALRATDEGVPRALAGGRPSLASRSSAALDWVSSSRGSEVLQTLRQSLTLSQTLLDGGETKAALSRANSEVQAERARLIALEQDVLLDTVRVFAGVARDQAILDLAQGNEHRLKLQLDATQDRVRFGDLTKTDRAQAQARSAGSIAERIRAEGQLASTAAEFTRLVGEPPGRISLPEPPEADAGLGQALEEAEDNPLLFVARFELEAAKADIALGRSAFRPRMALRGELAYANEPSTGVDSQGNATLGTEFVLPLYQGGGEYARLRQAKEVLAQRQHEEEEARRGVTSQVSAAVEDLRSTRARIGSLQAQVDAAAFAVDGVRQEALAGARSVIETLDAEADLFAAEVDLAQASAAELVAAYALRAATGRLTAHDLGLEVEPYDPAAHYRRVQRKWMGVGGPAPKR